MPPRVTVITATYDRPDCLELALSSLVGQTFADFEGWVIGDACAAPTAAVVAGLGDPRLRYFNRATNSGSQAAPNNDGLARANGELIAYLGHDDLWLPWHLGELVEALDASGADLVYGLAARIGPDGVVGCLGPPALDGDLYHDACCPPSSWLLRREALTALGGWRDPETIDYAVDRDVLVRLLAAGRPIHGHPRLTLLKFPSTLYPQAYRGGAETQARYAAAMGADPQALGHQVLSEVAAAYASHRCPRPGWGDLVRRAGALLLSGLERLYGRQRWPLPALRVRTFQRSRRLKRITRGLDS